MRAAIPESRRRKDSLLVSWKLGKPLIGHESGHEFCPQRGSGVVARASGKSGALNAAGTVHRSSLLSGPGSAAARCASARAATTWLSCSSSDGRMTIRPTVNADIARAAMPAPMRGTGGSNRIKGDSQYLKGAARYTPAVSRPLADARFNGCGQSREGALYNDFTGKPVLFRLFQRLTAGVEKAASGFILGSARCP